MKIVCIDYVHEVDVSHNDVNSHVLGSLCNKSIERTSGNYENRDEILMCIRQKLVGFVA